MAEIIAQIVYDACAELPPGETMAIATHAVTLLAQALHQPAEGLLDDPVVTELIGSNQAFFEN